MARYPTFDEYEKTAKFDDGVQRCDELLRKSPDDVVLLTTKLRLLNATNQDGTAVLETLVASHPPIQDLGEIVAIEDAVTESQKNAFPVPNSAGPLVAKLWDGAFRASVSMNHKLDVLFLRYSRATVDRRMLDAQQALIQLKALQPKNRIVYMAHAAITQMISTSKDDLQARLALSLARKAVTERFDDDQTLDCRVPGQIFALQSAAQDLAEIKDRPSFRESKQVYDALRKVDMTVNGIQKPHQAPDPVSMPASTWLAAEIENLETHFAALIESDAPMDLVRRFAVNALHLFDTARTSLRNSGSRRGPAEACFLAISALVRVFEQTQGQEHLLVATFLAESLLKHSPNTHEARLVLVYLYMRTGLGSLAMQMFHSLSVKEIQYDTVGHALFTRLSIIHPHSVLSEKKESIDPAKRMVHALSVYTRCEGSLAETQAEVLSHGQTGMIFDLAELRDSLRMSLSKRITTLERRRIARLLHEKGRKYDVAYDDIGPKVTANWMTAKDNRDFNAAFDYGFNVERALYTRNGAIPDSLWILFALVGDTTWCMAMENQPLILDPVQLLHDIEDVIQQHSEHLDMSDAEFLAGDLVLRVLKLLLDFKAGTCDLHTHEKSLRHAIEGLHIPTLIEAQDSVAEHLTDHYLFLDALRIVLAAVQLVDDGSTISSLGQIARQLFLHLQDHGKEQATRLTALGVKTFVTRDESLRQALAALGEKETEKFCEEVTGAAKDGWEGLHRIKLT